MTTTNCPEDGIERIRHSDVETRLAAHEDVSRHGRSEQVGPGTRGAVLDIELDDAGADSRHSHSPNA